MRAVPVYVIQYQSAQCWINLFVYTNREKAEQKLASMQESKFITYRLDFVEKGK